MNRLRRLILTPWTILLLIVIGWGPLFIAEFVRRSRPDLDASYAPQTFGIGWFPVTLLCMVLSVVLGVAQIFRVVLRKIRRSHPGSNL
jgi:hypothetical protein